MKNPIEIKKSFEIESARFLPNLPKSHPCSKMHGHSFKLTFTFQGIIDPTKGWLLDYNEISTKLSPLIKKIDHTVLNKINGLENPTTEILCIWIFKKVKKIIPCCTKVTIKETADTECSYPI